MSRPPDLQGRDYIFTYLLPISIYKFYVEERKKRMSDEILRKELKIMKALQGITYKEVAEYLEIKESSMYKWIQGAFNFSAEKKERLNEIIANLKE